jgi:hypothetical protein
MFRITQDPSSGSDKLYLTEMTYNGSNVLIICVVGVWRHILDLWRVFVRCVATHKHTRTHTNITMMHGGNLKFSDNLQSDYRTLRKEIRLQTTVQLLSYRTI